MGCSSKIFNKLSIKYWFECLKGQIIGEFIFAILKLNFGNSETLNCKKFFSTNFIILISRLSCFSFFSAFYSANLRANEPIHKYFSSIWFKLPENLFPEFLLVPASTVRCSFCMFVSAMGFTFYVLSWVQWEEKCELQIIDQRHTMI